MKHRHKTSLNSSGVNNNERGGRRRLKTVETSSPAISIEVKGISSRKSPLLGSLKMRLEEQIQIMLQKIKRIVQWQGSDLKTAMNYVRSSVLFKDIDGINSKVVDEIVGEYAKNKIASLNNIIAERDKVLKELKQEIKEEQQFDEIKLRSNSIYLNPKTDNVMYQLYKKAQQNSFQEFLIIYNKMHSHSQLTIKNHSNETFIQRKSKLHLSFQDYVNTLLEKMEEPEKKYFLKLIDEELRCNRPCCKWGSEQHSTPNPAQLYLTCQSPQSRIQSIYHNSQFNKYRSRYCGKQFKLSKVVSITRTHTEEMDKIYSQFKHKQQQKAQQHIRNRSVF